MARLKPNAGKSYRRSPSKGDAAFSQNRDRVAGPSSGTSSSAAASTANSTVNNKKEAKRKAPSDQQGITREEVERLFDSSESVIQPWEEIDLTGEDDEEEGTDDAGDDGLEGDEEEAPPPPNAHEIARAWTDQLAKEVFEGAGTSPKNVDVAAKAAKLWPVFARLLAHYDPDHLVYTADEGVQPLPGVKSRSFARPFFEFVEIKVDGEMYRIQRAGVVFAWMLVNQPEWQDEFWKEWLISFEVIKERNANKKMLASNGFGVYSLIEDKAGYIGATFTSFWQRLLQHFYNAVSRKMAKARALRALSKWSCVTVFEIPEKYRDDVPHIVVFLIETFWNATTRAANGQNLNTNKLDSAGWGALATRKTVRRGMLKVWELLSETDPDAQNGERRLIQPKILTKDWMKAHPELIAAFGVGAIGAVTSILTGHTWQWFIRSLCPIPIPPEAYPTLRYPISWQNVAERRRYLEEKQKRHDDVLYSYLQQQAYGKAKETKRARKSDEKDS
ncbi:hypothetical protein JCM3774_000604 [Rhodotorula dairenensis]